MSDLPERIASLSAAKRELLARRMRRVAAESAEPIPPREGDAPVPLSPMQERLWLMEQIHGGRPAYNLSQAFRLRGPLDAAALGRAFEALVVRHESLRTTFCRLAGQAVQVVGDPWPFPLPVVPAESPDHAARLAAEEARRPFDLSQGPLLRARLFGLGEDDHVLMITMHHLISDGWSVALLWQDVSRFYRAFAGGQSPPPDVLPVQYADFALWHRRRLSGEALAGPLAYWRRQLHDAPSGIELPYDRTPPAGHAFAGQAWQEVWPGELSDSLAAIAQRAGATPFMAHLAAFAILLRRYSGQGDLLIGSPIAARTAVETEAMIGFFVNTLALRIDAAGEPTFLELLERVRQTVLAGCENQDVPFDVLVADLKPDRPRLHMPLVQTMFGYQPARQEALDLPGVTISPAPAETGTSKVDLTAELLDRPEGMLVRLEFNTDVFDLATVERMGGHYRRLLEAIVADPHRSILRLPMLEEPERRRILTEWNRPPTEYLTAPSVHALVESWAKRTGDAPAVREAAGGLTYAQLNARANRLARRLREIGVGPESLVGLCLERSSELVVAMLAVLKAGGAYVPLDGHYPPARLAGLLAQTAVAAVLTQSSLRASLPAEAPHVVCLDTDEARLPADESDLPPAAGPDSLAYVIFTSGSTGVPKGVAVTHRAILRLVVGADYAPLSPDDVVAQASNAAFDAATFEIWAPLAVGASLAIVPTEAMLSPADLGEEIRRRGITTLFVTTALFNRIAEECPQAFAPLRRLLFGGEACDPHAVAGILRQGPPGRLVHVYGPTETTTFATWHEVT
ncbi:MAG: condensation domain-containing protein, partial [Planctomycetota bacterium]|nr:condensation domain-containing protein [Planctomycetota bacterium]